jgi:phosphoglycerol transferase MdoB-like AlkP superfamily enzyme
MIHTRDAHALIEDIQSVRHDLADRATSSPAWRFTSAALFGTICAAQAAPGSIALAISVCCFGLFGVMAIIVRKRMGFFVNGYRKGGTRVVAIALLVTVESIYFASLWLKGTQHIAWAPLVGGAIIVPIVFLAVSRWQAAYRSEFASAGATFAK